MPLATPYLFDIGRGELFTRCYWKLLPYCENAGHLLLYEMAYPSHEPFPGHPLSPIPDNVANVLCEKMLIQRYRTPRNHVVGVYMYAGIEVVRLLALAVDEVHIGRAHCAAQALMCHVLSWESFLYEPTTPLSQVRLSHIKYARVFATLILGFGTNHNEVENEFYADYCRRCLGDTPCDASIHGKLVYSVRQTYFRLAGYGPYHPKMERWFLNEELVENTCTILSQVWRHRYPLITTWWYPNDEDEVALHAYQHFERANRCDTTVRIGRKAYLGTEYETDMVCVPGYENFPLPDGVSVAPELVNFTYIGKRQDRDWVTKGSDPIEYHQRAMHFYVLQKYTRETEILVVNLYRSVHGFPLPNHIEPRGYEWDDRLVETAGTEADEENHDAGEPMAGYPMLIGDEDRV